MRARTRPLSLLPTEERNGIPPVTTPTLTQPLSRALCTRWEGQGPPAFPERGNPSPQTRGSFTDVATVVRLVWLAAAPPPQAKPMPSCHLRRALSTGTWRPGVSGEGIGLWAWVAGAEATLLLRERRSGCSGRPQLAVSPIVGWAGGRQSWGALGLCPHTEGISTLSCALDRATDWGLELLLVPSPCPHWAPLPPGANLGTLGAIPGLFSRLGPGFPQKSGAASLLRQPGIISGQGGPLGWCARTPTCHLERHCRPLSLEVAWGSPPGDSHIVPSRTFRKGPRALFPRVGFGPWILTWPGP